MSGQRQSWASSNYKVANNIVHININLRIINNLLKIQFKLLTIIYI